MTIRRWRLRSGKAVFSSSWLTVEQREYELASGSIVSDYFVVKRAPFVIVIASKDGQLVMVDQYRAATNAIYRSFPAGYIGENETPLLAAERELLEETGFEAINPVVLGVLDPLPGYIESRCHIIACTVGRQARAIGSDEFEELRITLLRPAQIEQAIAANDIQEMQAVAAFALYCATASREVGGPTRACGREHG
jgi:8-oxo-dGTP pyrophosphatase MutT (NUDIX family)